MKPTLAFIGAGRVASALAIRLHELHYVVTGVFSLRHDSAVRLAGQVGATAVETYPQADIVFLAVPDDVIAEVAAQLVLSDLQLTRAVVHLSGVHDLQALKMLHTVEIGSFHPLFPFREGTRLKGVEGMLVGIEASQEWLRKALVEMAGALGGNPVVLHEGKKALYHTAAVMASNYLVTLFDVSWRLMTETGVPPMLAREALATLMQGNLDNLREVSPEQALTGPIARGDTATVQKHLVALSGRLEETLYRELGRGTVGLAPGLTPDQRRDLLKLLEIKD